MQAQIVHETEVHRQHVRLKIPIQVEVDGVRYQVDDWSISGFGVESVITSRQPGERFPAKLIFPFEEFDMTMRFDARIVYADQEHGRFGCVFLGLSKQQTDVFRYLVDAYLSGEVVSAGDILQVRAHDNTAQARLQAVYSPFIDDESGLSRLRRYGGYAAFGLAGLALLLVIGFGVKERYLTIAANSAVVEAPLVQIRAPIGGRFVSALESGERVPPGTLLATVQGFDGSVVSLESPCDCLVLEQIGLNGQHYQVGDSLVILVEADRPLLIRAQLPLDEVESLEVGDRAEIRFPGRDELLYGQIERIDLRPQLEALRERESETPISHRLAQVVVRPDQPLEFDDFGSLVTVRFP
jgi:alginate biosynthesis protein Alg44